MQFRSSLPVSFFESVEMHPLSHRAGKYNVDAEALQIISYGPDYRGSKTAFANNLPPFWLKHEQTFIGTCQIFEKLFDHKPDLFAWFHDEEKTWNAFLVTSRRFHPFEESVVVDYAMNPELKPYRHYFDYFPVIGGYNSYEANVNPGLYYLIATPFGGGRGSFLTLSNFRFQREEDKARFVQPNLTIAPMAKTVQLVSEQFRKAESEFNSLLDEMANGSIDFNSFMPVVLDLYDINRNEESVANDGQLQSRIRRKAQAAFDFLPSPLYRSSIAWTDFIQFIIRNNEFDLSAGLRQEEVEELFARKRAYTKFERLFRKFLKDPARYNRYIQDQQADWLVIERYL